MPQKRWVHFARAFLVGAAAWTMAARGAPQSSKPTRLETVTDAKPVIIHSITDLSHEFSFYSDGRFGRQYLAGEQNTDKRNWGTLHKCNLDNVNLLVLMAGATPCPYPPADIAAVRALLVKGGGVVLLGDYALFRDEAVYHQNDLAGAFGARFVDEPATDPLVAASELAADDVFTYGGKTVSLDEPAQWRVLITDAKGKIVAARRKVGQGCLLVASRALFGRKPNASDPVNKQWIRPLMIDLAAGKRVDPDRPLRATRFDHEVKRGALKLSYSDYLAGEADAIVDIYERCQGPLRDVLGVPPSEGMMGNLMLLATGGGGFSSGHNTGLGIWWGGFPEEQYGMVQLIGHECTHAWVLPFAEPMWNEPIATYIGSIVGTKLGHTEKGRASIDSRIEKALELDPDMTRYDLANGKDVPSAVTWGKAMWIFEALRKEKPDAMARYFRAKRKLVDPAKLKKYTPDDSVAVYSHAMERNMFPWFQSLGITVDEAKSSIPLGEWRDR